VMAAGPYRYVRNPLYLGSWGMVGAMCFLMPPTGALLPWSAHCFSDAHRSGGRGISNRATGRALSDYLSAVPRLVPQVHTTLPPSSQQPHWLRAVIAEINPIGVFIVFAALSWSYNNRLMIQGVVVSFGVSLVVRALMPKSGSRAQ